MTVNHWVPGSSPGRGANFKASGENLGLFCFRRTLTRDPVPGDSLRSPLRGRAEARSAAQSSPGRGANFKASGENLGLFCFHRTLTRDAVPGDSLRSPLRGRAEARSAAQSSPGRGANFKASGENLGLFCFRRTLTRDLSQVIRFAHPFGAALKRVLLRSRVQVAEPTSKPQTSARLYFVAANLPRPHQQRSVGARLLANRTQPLCRTASPLVASKLAPTMRTRRTNSHTKLTLETKTPRMCGAFGTQGSVIPWQPRQPLRQLPVEESPRPLHP
jgi:hypothetical protein